MKKVSKSMPTLLIKTPFKGRGLHGGMVGIHILNFNWRRYRPFAILIVGARWDNDTILAELSSIRFEFDLAISDRVIDRYISRCFRESNIAA